MKSTFLLIATAITLLFHPNVNFGQPPNLGAAVNFGLFTSDGAFNNIGPTIVIGEVGTGAGVFTGFPPGAATLIHPTPDAITAQAKIDLDLAYTDLAGRNCAGNVINVLLHLNAPLGPGVYCTGAAASLDGNLTLDGQGDPNALFIIQIDGALATTTASTITLINSASFCNVYWQISGAVEIGINALFQGNIVSGGAISLYTGATLNGRGLTTAGAISSFTNLVSAPPCVPPVVNCPTALEVSCVNLVPSPDLASVTAVDNCGGGAMISFVGDVTTGLICPNQYTITRTYMASVLCGTSGLCTQIISVNDQTPPTILCPMVISPIQCPATPVFLPAAATDLCGGTPVITFLDVTVQNDVTRTWTATDDCGNTSTCNRMIVVEDNTLPTIMCPDNIVSSTDPNLCSAVVTYPTPTFSNNCFGVTLSLTSGLASGSTFPTGINTVTFAATDGVGNVATCGFTVTVTDNALPTIICPTNIVKNTDPNLCSAVVTYPLPTFSNNCFGVTLSLTSGLTSGSAFPKGINMVTFKATDGAGKMAVCGFTVTVTDIQKPTINCPSNQTKSTTPNLCTAVVTYSPPTVADNCTMPPPTVMLQSGPPSGSVFPKGVTTIVFKATDGMGLTKTCSFRVTVNDLQAPTLTCPLSIVTNTDVGLCSALTTYLPPIYADNCPSGTVVRLSGLASGSAFPKGVNVVVWKATDATGNIKTCSFNVTVNDVQQPFITCPADIVKSTDLNLCAAVGVYVAPTATDNCSGISTMLVSGLASGSLFPLGTNTVIWKTTDGAGLMNTCSFTVTVNDAQAPMVMCPGNTTVNGSGNPCGYVSANLQQATVMMENCSNFTLMSNAPAILPEGITQITWTTTDAANNVSTCAYTVAVNCTMTPWSGGNGIQSRIALTADSRLGLTLAPNPSTSQVTFFLEGVGEKGGQLTVLDQLGRTMWQQSVMTGEVQVLLDVSQSNFSSGVYQARLLTEKGVVTKGLVINKL